MLFDLQGKRRRLVQVTYLTLALLMGGGLVFFGIGGDVSGGLFDAFSENRSGGGGDSAAEERIERAEDRLEENPRNQRALIEVVRANYQLATQEADEQTGQFNDEGLDRLRDADRAWTRYLELAERPDDSLAGLMVQAYSEFALNDPAKAVRAAEIVTDARPSAQAFLLLTRYAALAGQDRKADLAGRRAIELAPRDQREAVEAQVEQAKQTTPPAEEAPAGGG